MRERSTESSGSGSVQLRGGAGLAAPALPLIPAASESPGQTPEE